MKHNCRWGSWRKKISEKDKIIEEYERNSIDLSVYKSWDINTTMKWIKSLNNGKFTKYLDILREGFQMNCVKAADLPDLEQYDLSIEPFNIKIFGDRKKLCQHFQSLRRNDKQ